MRTCGDEGVAWREREGSPNLDERDDDERQGPQKAMKHRQMRERRPRDAELRPRRAQSAETRTAWKDVSLQGSREKKKNSGLGAGWMHRG